MIAWMLLTLAIATEVVGTLSLRMAATGKRRWYAIVAVSYVAAFSALSGSLAAGMHLGVAYGVWTAAGVALTAILSRLLFTEPFNWIMALGIALVALGVLLVELGSTI